MYFKFREQQTVSTISAASTIAQVKASLETLSTIREVGVDIVVDGNSDTLCTAAGNSFSITFLTDHGDLPLLELITANIDTITVTEDVKGTKEMIECSGRGLCDTVVTGTCTCFEGFGSSDGKGGSGTLGDCGYIEPVTPIDA